jgi:hypothetical protein
MLEIIQRNKIGEHSYALKGDWVKLTLDAKIKKALYDNIYFFRVESLFNYIYRLMYECTYLHSDKSVDKQHLLNLYYKVSNRILLDRFGIMSNNNHSFENVEFDWSSNWYLNMEQEFGNTEKTILDIINYSSDIRKAIGLDEVEDPYDSNKSAMFIQYLISIGYSMATNRILLDFESKSQFGFELVDFNDKQDLIIYLTPEGMITIPEEMSQIKASYNDDKGGTERLKCIHGKLAELGINFITDKERLKEFSNAPTINCLDNFFSHYKQHDLSANEHFKERINRHYLVSITLETQASFRRV